MHDGDDVTPDAATDGPAEPPERTSSPRHTPPPWSSGGLAGLVGAGPSRVGVSGAMRARDVARPHQKDLSAAERDLEIRHARPVDVPTRPARPVPRPPRRAPHGTDQAGTDQAGTDQTGSSPERS
jgi:hypothetical protein